MGAKRDGTLTALQCRAYGTAGVGRDAGITGIMSMVYKCPNLRLEDSDVYTNAGTGMAMRAPGFPQGSFAIESAMDELALELKMDPLTSAARILSICRCWRWTKCTKLGRKRSAGAGGRKWDRVRFPGQARDRHGHGSLGERRWATGVEPRDHFVRRFS